MLKDDRTLLTLQNKKCGVSTIITDDNKMKKFTIILTVLIAMTITTNAQIPNNGFENWPLSTNGWPVGNPIQSTDVYPIGVGNYSLKLQNNAVPSPAYTDFGFCVTFPTPGSWDPSFPITGHPNSFTGYYKFLPSNGDTVLIAAFLYLNGDTVSSAILMVNISTPAWTSFNIPFSTYTSADSASVGMSAYLWTFGQTGLPTMQGNSVLYVDNLNFDNLITTGISDISKTDKFSIFPNPFSTQTTLQTDNLFKDATLTVYNSFGQQVKQIKNISGQTITLHRDNLPSGLYFLHLTQDNKTITTDKLIITD